MARRWATFDVKSEYFMNGVMGLAFGLVACVIALVGCGQSEKVEKVYPVAGTIRIDGRPLENGMLSFRPADGRGGSTATIVKDGTFQSSAAAGTKVVAVDDMQKGRSYGGEASPLTAEVKPGAENRFDFDISSRTK